MAWFRRSDEQNDAQEAERIAREANEMVDPYAERAMVAEGDRVAVDPAQLLQNIHDRMERVDLDPDTGWSAQEIMSLDETAVMFKKLGMGEIVATETAWYAVRSSQDGRRTSSSIRCLPRPASTCSSKVRRSTRSTTTSAAR